MKVIDLATVKLYLGIDNSADDELIERYIPLIDAKVKKICKNNYNLQINVKTVAGSDIVEIYGTGLDYRSNYNSWPSPELDMLVQELPTGTLLEGPGIPFNSYIDEIYYSGNSQTGLNVPSFKMSNNATESNSNAYIYAGLNISFQDTIAKGLWFLTGKANKNIIDDSWKSKRIGPTSIDKGQGGKTELDGKSGMPLWFVRSLEGWHS